MPTTAFFLFISCTFLGAAVLHPQEFMCLMHGFVYYLAIPATYMLLMIFAMCNLHDVTWGTREVKPVPTENHMKEESKTKAEININKDVTEKLDASVSVVNKDENKYGCMMSCGNWCRFMCCLPNVNSVERVEEHKLIIAKLDKLKEIMQNNKNYETFSRCSTIEAISPQFTELIAKLPTDIHSKY